jgi:retinol dehydrogenase 12
MRKYLLLSVLMVSDIVFCSGVMASPYNQLTKDGYDMQFGVNVLAHFHFTTLLLDRLLASPEPRVVNVSSIAHNMAFGKGVYFSTLKGSRKNNWIAWVPGMELQMRYQAYSQSKLVSGSYTNTNPWEKF